MPNARSTLVSGMFIRPPSRASRVGRHSSPAVQPANHRFAWVCHTPGKEVDMHATSIVNAFRVTTLFCVATLSMCSVGCGKKSQPNTETPAGAPAQPSSTSAQPAAPAAPTGPVPSFSAANKVGLYAYPERAKVMISSSSMSPTAITRLSSRQASTRICRLRSRRLLLMSRQRRRRRLMLSRNKKAVEPKVRLVAQLAVR